MNAPYTIRIFRDHSSLWLARLIWLGALLLLLGLLTANIPYLYLETSRHWQVEAARPAALRLFPTHTAFVRYLVALKGLVLLLFSATSILLAWRKWNQAVVLLIAAVLLFMGTQFGLGLSTEFTRYPAAWLRWFPGLRQIVPAIGFICVIFLFYLFPDGQFYPGWSRYVAIGGGLGIAVIYFFTFVSDYQTTPVFLEAWGWQIFIYALLGLAALGLAFQIYRYRKRATQLQRQQIKLVLFSLGTLLGVFALMEIALRLLGNRPLEQFLSLQLSLLVPALIPLAIAVSILRYRLWDVDLLINRTLVYGLLTAIVLVLYGLSVGLASRLAPLHNRWLLSLLALVAVAPILSPARRRLQALVDRWLPAPAQVAPPEMATGDPGHGSRGLRLARAVWFGLALFLTWQIVTHFLPLNHVLQAIRSEWLVRTSLAALPGISPDIYAGYLLMLRLALLGIFWVVAALIYLRQRNDPMALFVAFFLLLGPVGLILIGDEHWLDNLLSLPVIGLAVLLPFLFPDGRFIPQSARWRALLLAVLLGTPFLVYPLIGLMRPDYMPDDWGYAAMIATVTVAIAAGVGSQVYRYRIIATITQRQQTKWVLLGLGFLLGWFLLIVLWLSGALARPGMTEAVIALTMIHANQVAPAAIPITIGISILRYRLWDIDLIINRTLVFGGLTLLVASAYIVVVGLLGVLLQTGDSLLLSVIATGLVAILFNPLRQRLQQAVNRLMYGDRDDPATVLNQLGERLAQTAMPGETLPALAQSISQTLKLPYVAITVSGGERVAHVGNATASPLREFQMFYQREEVGKLVVATRSPGEPFTEAEERLLQNVARQAGAAVYAHQVTDQLQRSRERLVTTREEERRRLRRDLHDGLGPQLATLTIKVSAARNLIEQDGEAAARLLAEVESESQNAIKEIRRVVDGLRPSSLDQLGLVSALQEFVAQRGDGRTRITFSAPSEMPPLPAAVEVAAYRIVTEAVTNVLRHAQAATCVVELSVADGLRLEVRDDGKGISAGETTGVGLASMRERTEELGGQFLLESSPTAGTRVRVDLPL